MRSGNEKHIYIEVIYSKQVRFQILATFVALVADVALVALVTFVRLYTCIT